MVDRVATSTSHPDEAAAGATFLSDPADTPAMALEPALLVFAAGLVVGGFVYR